MKVDTRSKIVPYSRISEFCDSIFVAMYLDPLTSEHGRRLAEIAAGGRPVVVLLFDPPSSLLSLPARAELAASLDSVSAVAIVDGPVDTPFIDERQADLRRRDALVQHVRGRHAVAAGR